jgi:hypothetical protein
MNDWPINPAGQRRPNLSWTDRNPLQRVEPGTPFRSRSPRRHEVRRLSLPRHAESEQPSTGGAQPGASERAGNPGGDKDGDLRQHPAPVRPRRRLRPGVSRIGRWAARGRPRGRRRDGGGLWRDDGRGVVLAAAAAGQGAPRRRCGSAERAGGLRRASNGPGSRFRAGGPRRNVAGRCSPVERSGTCVDDHRGGRRGSGFTRGGVLRGARRYGGLHR